MFGHMNQTANSSCIPLPNIPRQLFLCQFFWNGVLIVALRVWRDAKTDRGTPVPPPKGCIQAKMEIERAGGRGNQTETLPCIPCLTFSLPIFFWNGVLMDGAAGFGGTPKRTGGTPVPPPERAASKRRWKIERAEGGESDWQTLPCIPVPTFLCQFFLNGV